MVGYMRTKSLRTKIPLAVLGVWMSAFNLLHPTDAIGECAVQSSMAGASVGSGGETSFSSGGSVKNTSRSDPIALLFLGLGLLSVAALWRGRFKQHRRASRDDLLRPAGNGAGGGAGGIRFERHSGRRPTTPRQAPALGAVLRPMHRLSRARHRPASRQDKPRTTGSMPDVPSFLFSALEFGQEISRSLEKYSCPRRN